MSCPLCAITSGDDNTVATISIEIEGDDEWDGLNVSGTMRVCAVHADLLREAYSEQ